MINFVEVHEGTYKNEGELVDNVLINQKVNYYTNKNIDLRRTNVDEQIYINIGEESTAEEINQWYNYEE